jgi:hypothetical protein
VPETSQLSNPNPNSDQSTYMSNTFFNIKSESSDNQAISEDAILNMQELLKLGQVAYIKQCGTFKDIPPTIKKFIDKTAKTITSNEFSIINHQAKIEANDILRAQNEIPKYLAKNVAKTFELISEDNKTTFLTMLFSKLNEELKSKIEKLKLENFELENSILTFNLTWLEDYTIHYLDHIFMEKCSLANTPGNFGITPSYKSTGFIQKSPSEHIPNLMLAVTYYSIKKFEIATAFRSNQELHAIIKLKKQLVKDEQANKARLEPMPQTIQELSKFMNLKIKTSNLAKPSSKTDQKHAKNGPPVQAQQLADPGHGNPKAKKNSATSTGSKTPTANAPKKVKNSRVKNSTIKTKGKTTKERK